jgi:hypothetical protein
LSGEETPLDRIELKLLASGEVTYRAFPVDGSDYIGGVLPNE